MGTEVPLSQRGTAPIFGPYLLWPNGSMDQDATWYGGIGLDPSDIALGEDPGPPTQKGVCPQFSAHVYCGQTAAWIKMSLGMQIGLGPGHIVLDGDPAPPPQKRDTAP